ncbi:MAG: hypothetical protein OXU27_11150 [Candidatus Poribacteria bacterium]|nr:hypothetical protein [Candidatus Poribacteria bacterium]MDE0324075.1 hypothetical protein [Candidatus Poribacteria bacterium]
MAYSDFTLEAAVETFHLEIVEPVGIFSNLESVDPEDDFTTRLTMRAQLADAINTDKAKSELIISNVIAELRQHHNCRISFFSGTDFDVDAENGLTGVCDFLISLSPTQLFIRAPVAILVEVPPIAGKDESIIIGLGPCVAKMVAAQHFNTKKGSEIPCIYGATTKGTEWMFLKLEEQRLSIDLTSYPITQCDQILGILSSMVEQKA